MEKLKDAWSREIRESVDSKGRRGHSNWIETKEAQEIVERIQSAFPQIHITFDEEYFILSGAQKEKKHFVPRHYKIGTSSDGKRLSGEVSIEEMLAAVAQKYQNGDIN